MKLFVADRWTDRERAHEVMRRLQVIGHSITRDWTVFEAADSDVKCLREYSIGDLDGVRECDVFILLADQDFQFRGAYAELGAAIAYGKPCIIVGIFADKCIHSHHPLVRRVAGLEELYEELKR